MGQQFTKGDLKFTTELKTKAEGLQVLQIINRSTGEIVKLGVTATWQEANGQVIISNSTAIMPAINITKSGFQIDRTDDINGTQTINYIAINKAYI